MPRKLYRQEINDFSPMLNVLDDPREIAPIDVPGVDPNPAECVVANNVEVSGGAILTSAGYELVSSHPSATTGPVKFTLNYEKDQTAANRRLLIVHDDDIFEITTSSNTWVSVGSYGTAADNVGGIVYKGTGGERRAIIGTDEVTNNLQKYDLTTLSAIAGSQDGFILSEYNGRLFVGSPDAASVEFTAVEDETTFSTAIGFNDFTSGLWPEDQSLVVATRDQFYEITFLYDDANVLSVPLKQPIQKVGGCLSHKSMVSVFSDIWYWGNEGFESFRFEPQITTKNRRISTPSSKILPLLRQISATKNQNVFGLFEQKKIRWAVPLAAENNNSLIVYDWDYDSWTVRTGVPAASLSVFRNSDDEKEIYFGSSLSPDLYKFNDSYSYNGSGYERRWTSKIFTFGQDLIYKDLKTVELSGEMPENTTFFVDVRVDGNTTTFQIDSSNLLEVSEEGGQYYGAQYYSQSIFGSGKFDGFKRFSARLEIPSSANYGLEIQVSIYNDAAGEPWKVDTLALEYELGEKKELVPTAVVNTTI